MDSGMRIIDSHNCIQMNIHITGQIIPESMYTILNFDEKYDLQH